MEPTSNSSSLASEIAASRARINQKRRSASADSQSRTTRGANGSVMRVDAAQPGTPAPVTRAERLQSFVETLRSSNQAAAAKTASLRTNVSTEVVDHATLEKARARRPDFSSPAGQEIEKKVNKEIADAIESLDASRQKYADLVAEKKLLPEHEVSAHADEMSSTKDELVASISKAIATVLTDLEFESSEVPVDSSRADVAFAEPEIESFVPAVPAAKSPAVAKPEISTVKQTPPVQAPVAKPNTLEVVDSNVFNVGAFIPVDVAAWDVEEFVWPMIIDQFLDVGEQAISRLANFSMDILDGSQHRLAVTSVRSGAGASTIACSIAKWSAKMKKRVLLVDANVKSPALAKSIGLAPNISWVNVVRESLNPAEAIIRCKSTGVCVMPLGEISDRGVMPANLLDQLGTLLNQVQHSFDLIVLDVGVAGQLPLELSASKNLVDAAMIVDSNVASQTFRQTKDGLLKFGVSKFVAAQNSI